MPLYGDDVGWLVLNNPDSGYLDGRVISRVVVAVIRWIFSRPDVSNWVLFSSYIMLLHILLLLFTVQSICGSMRKGLQAPAVILLTAVLLYLIPSYSYAYMTRLVMYVFMNIYVLSVILYLAFYNVLREVYHLGNRPAIRTLIGINLLGLSAGLSHEAYGDFWNGVINTAG